MSDANPTKAELDALAELRRWGALRRLAREAHGQYIALVEAATKAGDTARINDLMRGPECQLDDALHAAARAAGEIVKGATDRLAGPTPAAE